jgi:hypothetical protein
MSQHDFSIGEEYGVRALSIRETIHRRASRWRKNWRVLRPRLSFVIHQHESGVAAGKEIMIIQSNLLWSCKQNTKFAIAVDLRCR